MASSGVAAFGTYFTWHGAASDVVELTGISGPSETVDTIDLTSHDSPDKFREFVAGLHDGGEITIEGNFIVGDTPGQIVMHTDFQAGTAQDWIIKFPGWGTPGDYPQLSGSGIITAFSMDFPFDGKISFTATIKVSGIPTLYLG